MRARRSDNTPAQQHPNEKAQWAPGPSDLRHLRHRGEPTGAREAQLTRGRAAVRARQAAR
jgi:hypothetical protein